jgi:type I restriction enzyme R subunit
LYNNLKSEAMEQIAAEMMLRDPPPEFVANPDPYLILALRIHDVVKAKAPDEWRGVQAREQIVKTAIYSVLNHIGEVERLFSIIKEQKEY